MIEKALVYLDINNLFHRYKKLDFVKLREYIEKSYTIIRATAYNSIDHKNDSQNKFNTYLSNNHYRVEDPDVSVISNVDPMIITQLCSDSNTFDHKAIIVVACDGGYSYTLNELAKCGYIIHVIGAKGNTSLELVKVADRITYLEDIEGIILEKKD